MNKTRIFSGVLVAGLLATAPAALAADQGLFRFGPTLEGAWDVVVTIRAPADNCATAPIVPDSPDAPNPFKSHNTFHLGGTMSEFGIRVPPAARSPGHGVWERLGLRSYAYRNQFYSFDPESNALLALMDLNADLRLSRTGDAFTGSAKFVRTLVDETVLNFCATLEGTRITL